VRALEQAAEIFFAGDVLGAFFAGEIGEGFVFHFEPHEPHDADVFLALFPDLALAQLHGNEYTNRTRMLASRIVAGKSAPPDFGIRKGSNGRLLLLFLGDGLFRFGFFSHNFIFPAVDLPAA
jgi:hypothetical protein